MCRDGAACTRQICFFAHGEVGAPGVSLSERDCRGWDSMCVHGFHTRTLKDLEVFLLSIHLYYLPFHRSSCARQQPR